MDTFVKVVGFIFLALVVAFAFSILLAFPTKWLWNSTVTELFGFKQIDVWMAWKLAFLSSLLFKSTNISAKS